MFDACFYINLAASEGRRAGFLHRAAETDWPFPRPERWPGVCESAPAWWRTGDGAWGCFLAHFRLYQHCMERGIQSAVIFEDDAVFVDDFAKRFRQFMAAVPDDWQHVCIGGNHVTPPTVVNRLVLRAKGCNGTWAYALRREGFYAIHELLSRFPIALRDENAHIDVFWNTLHQAGHLKAYTPWRGLVGQAAGRSDRCGYVWNKDEFFNISDESLKKAELQLC